MDERRIHGRIRTRAPIPRRFLLAAEDDNFFQEPLFEFIGQIRFPVSSFDMYRDQASNWLRITTSEVPLFE